MAQEIPAAPAPTTTYLFDSAATTQASTSGIDLCINVTNYDTDGSYSVTLDEDNGGFGAALYHATPDGNEMNILANIAPTLSFNIVDVDDGGDLNICNLGTVSTSTALPDSDGSVGDGECGYGLAIGTNSASGFTATIKAASGLTSGTATMANVVTAPSIEP